MKRGLFVVSLVFLISLVSAVNTEVTVIGYPNSEATVSFLTVETYNVINVTIANISETGTVSVVYNLGVSNYALSVIVRKNGKIVGMNKVADYDNLVAGAPITIDTLTTTPTNTFNMTNTTANTNESVSNSSLTESTTSDLDIPNSSLNVTNSSPVGAVIQVDSNASLNKTSFLSRAISSSSWSFKKISLIVLKIVIYVAIILAALVLVYFFIKWIKERRNRDAGIARAGDTRITIALDNRALSDADKRIKTAQEEIRKAQEEINKIKNRDSAVREAEQKFLQAKRDLERLKRILLHQ